MKKTLRLFLVAVLAMVGMNAMAQEVTLDFTPLDNPWKLPTDATTNGSYTNGSYTISLSAATSFKLNTITTGTGDDKKPVSCYLIMGKKGSTLTLPVFSFDVEKKP